MTYVAYVRVSTPHQAAVGASLEAQRRAIEDYAAKHRLTISTWFEEHQTAARTGRTQFKEMVRLLRQGRARGVILHKVDRGARNLKDWAELGELIDAGVEVRFVHDALDVTSRGGRLTADIQAVIAADYVRNLREETRKGFEARLRQGLYPLPAPLGCLDAGGGKPKIPDHVRAPFIRAAFELYASGQYSLRTLTTTLADRGLGTRLGQTPVQAACARTKKSHVPPKKGTWQTDQAATAPPRRSALTRLVSLILSGDPLIEGGQACP